MSTPQNILGKFDTYAYHHILMVCNSTEAAEALSSTDEITTYQHPRNAADRYTARDIPTASGGGKYVTLIDGTTDARFYITDVNWTNYIAAEPEIGADSTAQSTTMSTDGEMTIIEPLGANFLNKLIEICDELDSDPVGLVFILKTIFVGRNASASNTEMISTVRPLMFITFDITAVFDSSGAKYNLAFVGLTNGAGKLPQPQKIFEGINFVYDKSSLLNTFKALETAVNEKYKGFKQKAIVNFALTFKELDAKESLAEAEKFLIDNYRDVTYRIIADDIYKDYPAGDNENIRISDNVSGYTVNYGPNVSVEDILNKIMASSTKVQKDGQGKGTPQENKNLKKYIYKIISTVRSTTNEYIVEYHIKRFLHAESAYTQQEKNGKITPLPGQSIEFDYIFTGKNIDIKTFDIKMEMGMAFFQIAATTDNVPSQKTALGGTNSKTVPAGGSSTVATTGSKTRSSTPLFLGSTLKKNASRNTKRPIDSAGFQALLDRHASLENVSANMVIYGNPQLLDEMTILPSEIGTGIAQTEEPVEGATINPRWMSTPTLIKVNVKMPVDANDVNTQYEDFWYTGWYNLQVVENKFADGEFTQELGMFSIPISDQIEEVTDVEEEENTFSENVKEFGLLDALQVQVGYSTEDEEKTQLDKEKMTAKEQKLALLIKQQNSTNEFGPEG